MSGRIIKTLHVTSFAVALGVVALSVEAGHHKHSHDKANLVQTASSVGMFNTLLTAATKAGLADTLANKGPFTVFAPTDEAFAKLPEGALDALLADKQALKQVLLLHVVPAKVKAKAALSAGTASTLYGQPLSIASTNGAAKVNGVNIVKTDVMASNGVIHVIDEVLIPRDIVGIAAADSRFTTLVAALKAAGLVDALQQPGPFTVFAPTNAAFAKLPDGTVQSLLEPANIDKLKSILTYHVASGAVASEKVVKLDAVKTLQGGTLDVAVKTKGYGKSKKTTVMIGDAKVIIADIKAANGVIHVIDTVLLP